MTRILFYLPNVTLWWFDNVVAPLARILARECEVHIMVPPRWRSTGIEPAQLLQFADGPDVTWHILDGDDHPSLRTAGSRNAELRDLVTAIDADCTLCRCADPEAVHAFPGMVRYIMEGAAAPIVNGGNPIIFTTRLFEHGALPPLTETQAAWLDANFAGIWAEFEDELRAPLPSWRAAAAVAPDRKVLAVPLEYQLEDSFMGPHHHFPDNIALIDALAASFGEEVFLAFTNHPLNDLYGDNAALEARIAALGGRGAMIRSGVAGINATDLVARDCDGAFVDLSKSYLVYAYFGVPIVRPNVLATAPWLNAARDLGGFAEALEAGAATPPDPIATRRWFAHHIANSALDLANRKLTPEQVLDHVRRPFNPDRWQGNIDRFVRQLRRQAAQKRLAA